MYDVIIVGAGPIGLYGATLCALHNLDGFVLESLDTPGGQLTELYPEKDIIDLPGFERIKAGEFIKVLLDQATNIKGSLPIKTGEKLLSVENIEGGVLVKTDKGSYETKTVLLTTGMGSFTPRKTGLENEDNYTNIAYAVKDLSVYKDKKVVVLGGGDSAVDWSIALSAIAASVSIVHRRDEFRAQSATVDIMVSKGVKVYKPYGLVKFNGVGNKVESLVIKHNETGATETLELDNLIVNYGNITTQVPLGLEMYQGGIAVNTKHETSAMNIYAVGNCINYDGKVKNITCGFGEAVVAITEIDRKVHPGKNIPVHF